ncbi:MAG: 3-deoxy-7-phosphoheptulonate synthase [Spirochaetes bacterium]|nr:3-deoxy-7-phosphoheptulonate synthase [Spirochaetota bacterium]
MALTTPEELVRELPLSKDARILVERSRIEMAASLSGKDPRPIFFVGPCSIHDKGEAIEYAGKLARFTQGAASSVRILLRAYIEKSRTALGWRGLARDPDLDGGRTTEAGIREARATVCALAEILPIGVELVNPFFWNYWIDTVSLASVGARGVDSQSLREAAAMMPCPCGFKNALDGEIEGAVNAALSASRPGTVVVFGKDGSVVETEAPGNPAVHVILRGGRHGPNWRMAPKAALIMSKAGLDPAVVIDASHDNSGKNPKRQRGVALHALAMRRHGIPVRGIMIESYLKRGRQNPAPRNLLTAGLSVTDACLGWEETERLLSELLNRL